jgi:hypothetical protein
MLLMLSLFWFVRRLLLVVMLLELFIIEFELDRIGTAKSFLQSAQLRWNVETTTTIDCKDRTATRWYDVVLFITPRAFLPE